VPRSSPTTATTADFVLVDVVTGQAFNQPAGTTGTNDTPRNQPLPPPKPAPITGQAPPAVIEGTYLWHSLTTSCGEMPLTTIRVGTYDAEPTTENARGCRLTFEATKQ